MTALLSPPVGRLLLRIQWKIYIWKEAPENTSSSEQKLHMSLSVQSRTLTANAPTCESVLHSFEATTPVTFEL